MQEETITRTTMDDQKDQQSITQQFNNAKIIERLPLPDQNVDYKVPLFSKVLLVKNYEIVDTLGMGVHRVHGWANTIENRDLESEFFMLYRINLKPRLLREAATNQYITYYDKKYEINFKFTIKYNYSFDFSDYTKLLKSVTKFKDSFTFVEMYRFIQKEISSKLQSFISDKLPSKDISIIEFNSYTKSLSTDFVDYVNSNVLDDFGIKLNDFNFIQINFDEDPSFQVIKATLFEKADMKIRDYTYNEKTKYGIIKKIHGSKLSFIKGEEE